MMHDAPHSDAEGRKLVFDSWLDGVSRLSAPQLLVVSPERELLGRLNSDASGEETLAFLQKILADNPHLAPDEDPTKTMVYDDEDPAERELAELESLWDSGHRPSLVEPLIKWIAKHGEHWDHGAATAKTLLGGAYYHAGDLSNATREWQEVVDQYPDHPARHRAFHNLIAPRAFPWLASPDVEGVPLPHPAHLPILIPDPEARQRNLNAIAENGRYVMTKSGLPLVRIEAGTFTMGGQPAHFGRELPLRRVTLTQSFLMSAWPTTYGMWRAFRPDGNPAPSDAVGNELPWTHASFADAEDFCQYLSEIDGLEYRLPTEAQWEYAARGGIDGAPYPWGTEPPSPARCNYDKPHVVPIACYAPNVYGLFDMVGNCLERTADPYVENAYELTPDTVVDPIASPDPAQSVHAVRGGGTGLDFFKYTCRNSFRVGAPDDYAHFGFRVIVTVD